MCGRYQFTAEQCEEIRQIADAIQQKYGAGQWTAGEIRPASKAPVLVQEGAGAAPALMKWGYQLPGTLVINARVHTPLKKCSLTADDGASPPLKWCTNSAEMVHGGRRRGARGRHAGNHSGMPLRLRMDSPSIWMV